MTASGDDDSGNRDEAGMRTKRRHVMAGAVAVAAVVVSGCSPGPTTAALPASAATATEQAADTSVDRQGSASPVSDPAGRVASTARGSTTVYAVGDIGDCGGDPAATSRLIPRGATLLALGDLAYPNGSMADFRNCYLPSYGKHRPATHPVPGNHEYYDYPELAYFDVFGKRAGSREKPWYTLRRGAWTVYQLNSNCSFFPGDCGSKSRQYRWLRRHLADHPARCIAVSWHHPRWSASEHGPEEAMGPMYRLLSKRGADLLLSGHEHNYQRFPRLSPAGKPDPAGLRQIVVGTGGAGLYSREPAAVEPTVFDSEHHGVLQLRLSEAGYSWKFLSTDGAQVDSGSDTCG